MDTCDRMGKPFLKLLKDVSDHQAHRISGAVNDDPHTRRAHRGAPAPRIPEQSVPPQHRPRPRHSYQHHPGTHSHIHALERSWTRHAGGRVLPQPHSRDQRRVLILTRISSNR